MSNQPDPPLEVPDAAVDALHACTGRERQDARAIAASIVAAELRAQADQIASHSAGLAQLYANRLRARADELDGGVR